MYWFIETELFHEGLVEPLKSSTADSAAPAASLGHLRDDGLDRVSGDEPGEEEIQRHGYDEREQVPGQFVD